MAGVASERAACCLRVALLATAALTLGCGAKTYQERLEESRKYFAYIEKLDANLAKPPFKGGAIEELRVPLQFQPVAAPPPVKNEKGEVVPPDVDPRQPNYLLIELPGLIGTWESAFDITSSEGREKRKGYIYVLSNAALPLTTPPEKFADFSRNVVELLAGALRVPTPDPTQAVTESYPRAPAYTVPNKFEVFRFGADQANISDAPHTVEVYIYRQGELQFVLVVVLPVGIDSSQKISERIQLMLERLRVSTRRQPAGVPKAAPTPGPASTTTPETPKPATGF